ncbi:hypothetical protein KEM52_000016 [Ascosphaera acerosa]|nr:hypothetical protein KEM52_000016 [Ascosphaera acerosa]
MPAIARRQERARDPTSAFDSPTFGEDSCFHIEQPVGSLSISPCGRDVVLASYVPSTEPPVSTPPPHASDANPRWLSHDSKEGLHIVDLDNPYSPPRYLPHHTPWEVADVQWSPFASRDFWVVSTSNQKALVWNLAMKTTRNSIEHVLHAHSRAITDINFSSLHPDVLATCAVDSFVHCWDLRTPARPAISFSDWVAGATQVKWNKHDSHVIASSHDRFLHIWDDRKGATPLRTINAHETKIYGVDWNRLRPEAIVTCSLDRTIKFWNYESEIDLPEKVIHTSYPVWRARNTPFGKGCLAMPQRGDSNLHLYSRSVKEDPFQNEEPVHLFTGHRGQVKEFVWRARGSVEDTIDHREFQLVSWDTEKELRLHKVPPEVLASIDYEKGKTYNPYISYPRAGAKYRSFQDESRLADMSSAKSGTDGKMTGVSGAALGVGTASGFYTRAWTNRLPGEGITTAPGMKGRRSALRADMDPISWMRGVKISDWEVETLGDEITHVGEKFTKVSFESVNVGQRQATISMHGPWGQNGARVFLQVEIDFPSSYPRSACPKFTVQRTGMMTPQLAGTLNAGLTTIAQAYLTKQTPCLEPALRYLLGEHSLDECIAHVTENDDDVKLPDIPGDDSSDEEDERRFMRGQDASMASDELLRPMNADVLVPVARASGAFWTNDGRLICFYAPKQEKPPLKSQPLNLADISQLGRSTKTFEAFGRLSAGSPESHRARAPGTATVDDATDANASDSMSLCSDDASPSSSSVLLDVMSTNMTGMSAANAWRAGSFALRKPTSIDRSMPSVAGLPANQPITDQKCYSLRIHSFDDLLPSKRSLAREYQILGNRLDVCSHNMRVAAEQGYSDLATVWGLLRHLIEDPSHMDKPAAGLAAHSTRNTSAALALLHHDVPLVHNNKRRRLLSQESKSSIIANWGCHPFGLTFLVPALFSYFERVGDVQMLAMLYCVLHEPTPVGTTSRRQHQSRVVTALHMGSGTGGHGSAFDNGGTTPQATRDASSRPSQNPTPQRSSVALAHMTDETGAPSTSANSITSAASSFAHNPSLRDTFRNSADDLPNLRVGSQPNAIASSLPRSTNLGFPQSLSPRDTSSINRRTANQTNSWGASNWATSTIFGRPSATPPTPRLHPLTRDDVSQVMRPSQNYGSETKLISVSRRRGQISVTLKNRERFKPAPQPTAPPLLNAQQAARYSVYCEAYSDLLFIWDLPIRRAEVLKAAGEVARTHMTMPHVTASNTRTIHHGLAIQDQNTARGVAASPQLVTSAERGTASGTFRPASSRLVLPCVICTQIIKGMYMPCLHCGHVLCLDCHEAWFCSNWTDHLVEEVQCPTGCGCVCSQHYITEVPMSATSPPPRPVHLTDLRRPSTAEGAQTQWKQFTDPSMNSSNIRATRPDPNLDGWQAPFSALARGISSGLTLRQGALGRRNSKRQDIRTGTSA